MAGKLKSKITIKIKADGRYSPSIVTLFKISISRRE
jgi:hypothetical protein